MADSEKSTDLSSSAGAPLDNRWDTVERVSRTLSIAAIPFTLAIVGWVLQNHLSSRTLSRDYVQLAVSILKEPEASNVNPLLRDWAVDLLNENSPTKFSSVVLQQLKSGELTLPAQLVAALTGRGVAAVSPDGARVVIVDPQGKASVWDQETGRQIASFLASAAITLASFSPDSRLLATGTTEGDVTIWGVSDGRALRVLRGHTGAVTGIAFSPDGRSLLTASLDGTAMTWSVSSDQPPRIIRLPTLAAPTH